jgi:dienelactone hydrolase
MISQRSFRSLSREFIPTILGIVFITSLLSLVEASAAETDPEAQLLRWMDAIAQKQLDARSETIRRIRSKEEAELRKGQVRSKILELIGGLPEYSGPLNARVTGRIERARYVIEKVVFESLPNILVTANLYRPALPGKYPGLLLPLGHWEEGKPAMQRMAINLALKGFVALAYDPIGQGERQQAYDRRLGESLGAWATEQHFLVGGQSLLAGESFARYRIWDARRALDYLLSRPEVESEKIGCTGCSGGGTVTTYIAALDARIKVAAPACYMNSFRVLFSGSVGDPEQSVPGFLAAGLDQTDFVELFAPKPWLIASTLGDFFTPEGARQVYEEAQRWYKLYGAQENVQWALGPGPHGTPLFIREAIYGWMIRWLKGGQGDAHEENEDAFPAKDLLATKSGQVSEEGSRDLWQVILERFRSRRTPATPGELKEELQRRIGHPATKVRARILSESRELHSDTQTLLLETEPGIELRATLLLPHGSGRRAAAIVVQSEEPLPKLTADFLARGEIVLAVAPRGIPRKEDKRPFSGDWLANTRASLIGRNLPLLRASDIIAAVDWLVEQNDVDPSAIHATARAEAGVWLLLAAAMDQRLKKIWVDRTPASLASSLEGPLHRNLYAAIIPGFCLKWDLDDLRNAIAPRNVLWSDPTDWLGHVIQKTGDFRYRGFEEGNDALLNDWLQ